MAEVAVRQGAPVGWAGRSWRRISWLAGNRHVWAVAFGLGFGAVLHYVSANGEHLLNVLIPFLPAPLTRHSLDRVLLVLPVVYAGFVFGIRGGAWTLAVALLIMLPRALLFSTDPLDAMMETVVVTASGAGLLWMMRIQGRERSLRERMLAETEALSSISAVAVQSLELREVLDSCLEKIARVMGAPIAWVYLLDAEKQELCVAAHHGFSKELLGGVDRLKVGEGLSGRVVQSGEPMVLESISSDSRLTREAVREEGMHGFLVVPLISKGVITGTIAVATRIPHLFTADDVRLLSTIANNIGVVIENARLYEGLRTSADNMRFYIREITQAQEDERLRIARELHDETAQALVLLSRRLDALASEEGVPQVVTERAEDLHDLADGILQEVRRFIRDLRPSVLDHLGMLPALQGLVSDLVRDAGIAAEFSVVGAERRVAPRTALVLFRIVQESLSNIRRHSGASAALVVLEFSAGTVAVTVTDHGEGFELPPTLDDLAARGKLGLLGMRERARLLGGELEVRSSPGRGTTVSVTVPA